MKGRRTMKPKEIKTFLAAVPVAVEKKLREEAKKENRSRTAQLAHILEVRYGFAQSPQSANEAQAA
jgi:hypothetical protein